MKLFLICTCIQQSSLPNNIIKYLSINSIAGDQPLPKLLVPMPKVSSIVKLCSFLVHLFIFVFVTALSNFDDRVTMYVYEEIIDGKKLTEIINETHENVKYLPGKKLPPNVVSIKRQRMFVTSKFI